jgi:hypothetical protein
MRRLAIGLPPIARLSRAESLTKPNVPIRVPV